MRAQLSLSNKVLILVTLPLLVQLGLLTRLSLSQSEAEADLKKAEHAREVSGSINEITNSIYSIISVYGTEESLKNISISDKMFNDNLATLRKEYKHLKDITEGDEVLRPSVLQSESNAEQGLNVLRTMKESFDRAGGTERDARKPMWRQLRHLVQDVMNSDLATAGQRARALAERSPEVQAQHRKEAQTMILAAGIFNLLLTAVVGIFLTKGITSKLRQMNDNTFRLASGLPLNPVIRGTDEIARLDQVFHDLDSALKEASRKEQAVFNNARDMICSLDEQGRITFVNPACATLLGSKSRDILQNYVIDLVLPEDKVKVLDFLDRAKTHAQETPVEAQMIKGNGTPVDTLWSIHWSPEEKSFFCIIHDISERRAAENMKQEVLAMVSHDLRTPLTTTMNALDFLESLSSSTTNEKESRYIAMAQRSVNRMMALINDLLDLEKARAGMMILNAKPTALKECFSLCADLVSGYAESAKVALAFAPTDLFVQVEERLFVRVLQNLVSNAVKYSNADGTVKVYALRENEHAHITVEDFGQGIPASQLGMVFERFHQAEGQLAKTKGGTGLGLTICKVMTELHGGKIWVESETGKGSKFQLTIPLAHRPIDVQQKPAQTPNSAGVDAQTTQ
jgi:PAS domain S-box-containing protein